MQNPKLALLVPFLCSLLPLPLLHGGSGYIRPYAENPFYWEYRGEPVVLLGGSDEDNLYQVDNLEGQLDLLASVGGNYIRCTMSCRDEGNVWWYEKDPQTGLYDLDQPGKEHWKRFARLLELCEARGIIVQIELWDRFDFARDNWLNNPFNPKNNLNYTVEESGFAERYELHPGRKENPFFRSVPALENNRSLLARQERQVDQLLSISLNFGNVLYCMDNETNESPEWGAYWSRYLKEKAQAAGVEVMTTEMWDAHDLFDEEHKATLDHPELYDFVDISQNNHIHARTHWDNAQHVRDYVRKSGKVRPLNTVKIYGANTGRYGTTRDAQERFWRNILGGLASTRFHRPISGQGLNDIARAHIRSMRMALSEHDIFRAEPAMRLLDNQMPLSNEAYCSAVPGESYLLFFPDGGDLRLRVPEDQNEWSIRWLDIRSAQWTGDPLPVAADDGLVHVVTPLEEGYWAAVVAAR